MPSERKIGTQSEPPEPYTLYYHPTSLASLMTRLTIAFARRVSTSLPEIREQVIDIKCGDQMEEFYLCEVNPKGTVPALTNPARLSEAITDSLDITYHLRQCCPDLWPLDRIDEVEALLREFHAIGYWSLTYSCKPQRASEIESAALRRLEDPSISVRHRDALKYKLDLVRSTRVPSLEPNAIKKAVENAQVFLDNISKLFENRKDEDSPWLLGTQAPTVLDAHAIPFLARLVDLGRSAMLDETLVSYTITAFETNEWQDVTRSGKTVPTS